MRLAYIHTIILLLVLVGSIFLQIYLSKRNKWTGLIIPLICFMFSITALLSIAVFTGITNSETTVVTETIDGVVVNEEVINSESDKSLTAEAIVKGLYVFVINNIPTAIYLAIYFACREKLKLRNELDKMNVQDLE